jgi:hypothetical protein
MVSSIKYTVLGLILGLSIAFIWYNKQTKTQKIEDADILVERIKAVKKLIVTEGYFSEHIVTRKRINTFTILYHSKKKHFWL